MLLWEIAYSDILRDLVDSEIFFLRIIAVYHSTVMNDGDYVAKDRAELAGGGRHFFARGIVADVRRQ